MGRNFILLSRAQYLRPTLFNIFLYDLFYIMNDTDFAIYADDNTPCVIRNNMQDAIFKL